MQIGKKSSHADIYGPRGFFVDHMELDLCVKFQVNQTYGVRGVAFPKTHFHLADWAHILRKVDAHHFQSLG